MTPPLIPAFLRRRPVTRLSKIAQKHVQNKSAHTAAHAQTADQFAALRPDLQTVQRKVAGSRQKIDQINLASSINVSRLIKARTSRIPGLRGIRVGWFNWRAKRIRKSMDKHYDRWTDRKKIAEAESGIGKAMHANTMQGSVLGLRQNLSDLSNGIARYGPVFERNANDLDAFNTARHAAGNPALPQPLIDALKAKIATEAANCRDPAQRLNGAFRLLEIEDGLRVIRDHLN
ncbi:MAG: hypothetical protein Q7R47_04235, partial [Candidatus Diapherotrites archaeon]|nr:hypothetical protein [Candidatus Diapherotrites archaeon]